MTDRLGDSRGSRAPRTRLRRWLTTITIALAASGFAVPAAYGATNDPLQPIGSAPVAPESAVAVEAPAADTVLHLSVLLNPRDPAGLNAFAASVSKPDSPQYRQYLSRGQVASAFGPTPAAITTVTNALTASGLEPGPVSPDGLSIPVTTTTGAAARALDTSFAGYLLPDGRRAYLNASAPKLPASVARLVSGIVGLTDVPRHTAQHTKPNPGPVVPPAFQPNTATPATATPTMCSELRNALTGLVDTQDYWEPASLASSGAYNTAQLYGQYGNTGQGVTVGLLELEGYNAQDIAAYQSCFGLHVPVNAVRVDGGPTIPVDGQTDVGLESALDIEAVAGLAPGSAITVYQGPDQSTDQQMLDVIRQMVTDDTAQVLSISWGACEADLNAFDPGMMPAEASLFAIAAAQGQTVLAASGDSGSTGCYSNPNSIRRTQLSVVDPAAQPYVTAVGGTRMSSQETPTLSTWNTPASSTTTAQASGGGVSAVESLSGSANYQSGVQGPGYANACNAPSGATCRQVPDVSALADPYTGYLVAFGRDPSGAQIWNLIGGTSAAAPFWAAITALADSSAACAANGPVGFANPALYQNSNLLTDVTTGNNALSPTGLTLYQAGTGYDMATGLGSPKAPQLVEALCAGVTASPAGSFQPVTPTRAIDTRTTSTPVRDHSSISVQIAGANGVPATGVTAVVLNVTATNPTAGSFLTVWPDGVARPLASNLNFSPGQTIPNLVTVPVGSNGKVDIYNLNGTVDVIADIFGYYTTGTGSLLQPVTPTRALDTRTTATPVGDHSSTSVQIAGANGIPATGITAVVLNVTATNPTAGSFLTVWPDGVARPLASNLNFSPGQTIPNLVTVPVGANGKVDIYNLNGTVDVIADIFGYYTDGGSGLKFHASAPHRLLDTRIGEGVAAGQVTPLGDHRSLSLPLTDTNGPGNAGPLGTAGGLMLNVTVAEPTQGSFVTVYPSGVSRPLASNLNFLPGQVIPNAALAPVNGPSLEFYNLNGTVQLIVDVFGYFSTT